MPDTAKPLACLDAAYAATSAHAACVLFDGWHAANASTTVTAGIPLSAEYEPGAFYKRELPVLLAVLAKVREPLAAIVIDGYVWLGAGDAYPGLGARLYEALGGGTPVIGIAKTAFRGDDWSIPVLRGASMRPLYVTSAGMPAADAARGLLAMHGQHRVPTMLRLADRLARRLTENIDITP